MSFPSPPLLIHGPAGDGKRDLCVRLASERRNRGENVWILVRTLARARFLQRRAMEEGRGLVDHPFLTFQELTRLLLPEIRPPRALLTPASRELLLREVVRQEGQGTDLARFPRQPGILTAVGEWLGALGRAGISTLAHLEETLPRYRRPGPREQALMGVLVAYEEALERRGVTDLDRAPRRIAAALRNSQQNPYFPIPDLLVVEGFEAAGPEEIPPLRALAERALEVWATVDGETPPLLPWLVGAEPWSTPRFASSQGVEHELPSPPHVEVRTSPHHRSELEAIAREIRRLLDQGASPSQIGVVFPHVEASLDEVEEVFPRFSIPFSALGGRPLSKVPVAHLVKALLDLPRQGWDLGILRAVVDSPLVRLPDSPLEAPPTGPLPASLSLGRMRLEFARFCNLAREAGVRRLDREGEVQVRAWLLSLPLDRREEESVSEEPSALVPRMNAMLTRIGHWKSLFPSPQDSFTLVGFSAWLKGLLARTGLLRRAAAPVGELPSLPDGFLFGTDPGLEALQRARNWNGAAGVALARAMEEFEGADSLFPHPPLPFSELAGLFLDSLKGRQVHRSGNEEGVAVMGRLHLPGVRLQHLYLTGLTDGEFPVPLARPVLFREEEALQIGATQGGPEEGRRLWQQALHGASRVILSHPLREGNRPLLPSLLLGEGALPPPQPFPPAGQVFPPLSRGDAHLLLGGVAAGRVGMEEDQIVALAHEGGGPHLLAGMAMHRQRLFSPLGVYDGVLASPWALSNLSQRWGSAFSASTLEGLARCPMRVFLQKVLGIEEPMEIKEEMDPLERGGLLHRILRRFYAEPEGTAVDKAFVERRQANPEGWVEEGRLRLASIAKSEFNRPGSRDLVWQEAREVLTRGLEAETGDEQGLLLDFLIHEAEGVSSGLVPDCLEGSFGLTRHEGPLLSPQPVAVWTGGQPDDPPPLKLRGAVDRIDRLTGEGWVGYVVYDYKTGAAPATREEVLKGGAFQLPLYLLAVLEVLGGDHPLPLGAAYYQLTPRTLPVLRAHFLAQEWETPWKPASRLKQVPAIELKATLLDIARRGAQVAADAQGGLLSYTRLGRSEGGCASCPMARACTVDHQRMIGLPMGIPQ